MKRVEPLACARVRRELQAIWDRRGPSSSRDHGLAGGLMPVRLQRHLESCPGCTRFLRFLSGYALDLKKELDGAVQAAWRRIPSLDYGLITAVKPAGGRSTAALPGRPAARAAEGSSRRGRLGRWLRAPLSRPIPLVRWAALSFAALLLVSVAGLQVGSGLRTRRAVRAEIERMVEALYRQPLLAGVELGLERARPSLADYLNDMGQSREEWLEDLVSSYSANALN